MYFTNCGALHKYDSPLLVPTTEVLLCRFVPLFGFEPMDENIEISPKVMYHREKEGTGKGTLYQ